MMKLKNKIALVTGGSRGIGRGIALAYAEEGADVVVNYFRAKNEADDVVSKITEIGRRAIAIQADVAIEADVNGMVAKALEEFGRIDILVNNSGWVKATPFLDMSIEEWDRGVAINLRGVFLCGQAVARVMVQNRIKGKIINVGSVLGFTPLPGRAHYGPAKAGVNNLTRIMAYELAPYGIIVNGIAPGTVDTGMMTQFYEEAGNKEVFAEPIPVGHIGQPEEIAPFAVLLGSDDASFIAGTMILIDGGMLACIH
jgi:NAD(P)-dependent dehydrogenase (short-subunit alcohol dehydrogenase family)